ncbi:hypothetical protein [Micromonospora sediminimaris]|uniref:Uncharacterized protein n=1 Tax=Micromonospora sediminimaris TaxID=547162 RepID=A0A9W5ULH2_9ACTN|nr:hypothetical protein [Micromonospora sediminimaris]GIJ30987.1 hypothetical protein Vse01_01350 [Micromonospora sediminimaris]SFC19187.1 hypothetical protein SAMN05216284_103138 [Micromonospora sediminimaris]
MSLDLRSRPGLRMAVAAVAIGAVLALATVVTAAIRDRGRTPQQEVASEGVRISVPAEWPRNALKCGTPMRDTYIVDLDVIAGCAVLPQPRVDYAEIKRANLDLDPVAQLATEAGEAFGHPVLGGGDVLPDGRTRQVVVVPDRQVLLVAVSSNPAVAEAIVRSLRVD